MKFAKKLLVLCAMMAMICVPAYADDEVIIDTSLLMFGSANLTVYVDGEISNALSDTYTPYDVVTVKAPNVSGKTFNYWANNEGKIISVLRQKRVQLVSKFLNIRDSLVKVEMRIIIPCVYTSIGTSASCDLHLLS